MTAAIRTKRITTRPSRGRLRVLIDHVWPRGSREPARLDEGARELAPGDELRRWFDRS